MEIRKQNDEKLHLLYIGDDPVMKMESEGVKMTLHFAKEEPVRDTKQVVVDILTSQCAKKVWGWKGKFKKVSKKLICTFVIV